MASCLALAALALTNMAACGNKSGCCKVVISVDTTCCSRCFSKALVLLSRVANAVMDLCFLSAVKQDGRLPNLASKSGRSCQCHFLIMPMPKAAPIRGAQHPSVADCQTRSVDAGASFPVGLQAHCSSGHFHEHVVGLRPAPLPLILLWKNSVSAARAASGPANSGSR